METKFKVPVWASSREAFERSRTDLFLSDQRAGQKILFGLRDAGETSALLPVIRRLTDLGLCVDVLADGAGKEIFVAAKLGFTRAPFFSDPIAKYSPSDDILLDPLIRISQSQPDLVVTGFSGTDVPGTELSITANAIIDRTPVIWVDDSNGMLFTHYRKILQTAEWIMPDYLCVLNKYTKDRAIDVAGNLDPQRVIITGQPAYDQIAMEDLGAIRHNTRSALGVDNSCKLVVYMGGPLIETSADSLEVLVQGLIESTVNNYKFILRRHPADTTDPQVYKDITSGIQCRMIESTGHNTNEIGASADLLVTIDSSEGTKAVFRGIPSIHILIWDILRQSPLYLEPPIIPVVEDGASIAIRERESITPTIQAMLSSSPILDSIKTRMQDWKVDGYATENVTNLILKVLANKQN